MQIFFEVFFLSNLLNILKMADTQLKKRLKMLLAEKHYSGSEFARRCGLSVTYVNSVKTSISFDVLESICKLFPDVNLNWLVLGTPPMINTALTDLEKAQKELATLRDKIAMQQKIIELYERNENGTKTVVE